MQRDLKGLAETHFDLLVVGAGFYGVAAAWDAAQRGLSVAIVDKGDIGGGTSFHNAKTLHGGVRALQQADLRQMRLFVRERRALMRIAPHLTYPIPFVIPTYRDPRRSRWLTGIGLAVHNLVSYDRNDGIDRSRRLSSGRILSREECLRVNPAIDPAGVTGGALWYDCQMYNTDRLTLSFLLSATSAGAAAANYIEATGFLIKSGSRIEGVCVRDTLAGGEFDIRARVVLNAAGPWVDTVLRRLPAGPRVNGTSLSRAMNVITRGTGGQYALGGLADSRFLFRVPWRDHTVIGTSHAAFGDRPDGLRVTRRDLEHFLADVNTAFPRAPVAASDVRLVHRGLLPAISGQAGRVKLLRESRIHDHRADGFAGLITIVGVRYTTARHTASQAVDAAFAQLGRPAPPCRTAVTPLAGGEVGSVDEFLDRALARASNRLQPPLLRRLALSYGSTYERVLQDEEVGRPLGAACAVTRAEIRHALREEMAIKLSDAVLRRTEAGSAECPGEDALRSAAGVMAADLGWTEKRIASEIQEVKQFYQVDEAPS